MTNRINLEDWLAEAGNYASGTNTSDTATGPPTSDPYQPGQPTSPSASPGGDPNVANQPNKMDEPSEEPDYSADPQFPDMPEDKKHLDFEQWKKEFIKLSIKGDVQEMKDSILDVRNRDLESYQNKFVMDNLQILFLREQSNVDKASKEIKKMIREDLDHNNPGVTVVNHLTEVLQTQPLLNNTFIKLTGLGSMKGDLHRKFIAALTGSIQVSGGGDQPDIIYNEKDFSIKISTRFNARFGDVHIGAWSLSTDDPKRYLKPPELQRLEDGSPEEKDVLRRRVVMESIAKLYEERAFVINVVNTDGTIYNVGWDISTSLKSAYTDGRLVVRTKKDDGSEAMIDDDGKITSFVDLKIMYTKDTGEVDEDGKAVKRESEFIVRRQGHLFLNATLKIIKECASSFPGIVIREMPYQGNPSDLKVLQRCVPTATEILMKQCG
jgi:hypothetical protein